MARINKIGVLFLVTIFSLFFAVVVFAEEAPVVNEVPGLLYQVNQAPEEPVNGDVEGLLYPVEKSADEDIFGDVEGMLYMVPDVSASDLGVSEPKILPSSRWYFLKEWWRGLKAALTFDKVSREELRLETANERLLEIQKMMDGKLDKKIETQVEKLTEKNLEELARFKKFVEEHRAELENNESYKILMDENISWEVKRQYLMKHIQAVKQLKPEVKAKVKAASESSLNDLVEINKDNPKNLGDELEEVAAKGEGLESLYNVQLIDYIQARVEANIKKELNQAKQAAIDKAKAELDKLDEASGFKLLRAYILSNPPAAVISQIRASAKPKVQTLINKVEAESASGLGSDGAPGAIGETMKLFQSQDKDPFKGLKGKTLKELLNKGNNN